MHILVKLSTFIVLANVKMRVIIKILILLLFLSSCWQVSESNQENINIQMKSTKYNVQIFEYDSLTIPDYFKTLLKNHIIDFYQIDSLSYYQLCRSNGLNTTDSMNIKAYFTIKILHDLFTSQTASNCSKGEILNIPYVWHWVNPNPRHDIYFVETNQLLCKIKAPQEFSRYNSYADIDRTPYLFLSDLVQERPKYYSASCDTFSTFGWCSEREMAYIALTKLLNYDGKVVAEGNHSWSEFVIPLMLTNRKLQNFKVTVDNTFNSIIWTKINQHEIAKWKDNYGNSPLAQWYNQKASSEKDLQRVKNHLVSKKFMSRIEIKIVNYLKKRKAHFSN